MLDTSMADSVVQGSLVDKVLVAIAKLRHAAPVQLLKVDVHCQCCYDLLDLRDQASAVIVHTPLDTMYSILHIVRCWLNGAVELACGVFWAEFSQ